MTDGGGYDPIAQPRNSNEKPNAIDVFLVCSNPSIKYWNPIPENLEDSSIEKANNKMYTYQNLGNK